MVARGWGCGPWHQRTSISRQPTAGNQEDFVGECDSYLIDANPGPAPAAFAFHLAFTFPLAFANNEPYATCAPLPMKTIDLPLFQIKWDK